jgi:hypothetical protein
LDGSCDLRNDHYLDDQKDNQCDYKNSETKNDRRYKHGMKWLIVVSRTPNNRQRADQPRGDSNFTEFFLGYLDLLHEQQSGILFLFLISSRFLLMRAVGYMQSQALRECVSESSFGEVSYVQLSRT